MKSNESKYILHSIAYSTSLLLIAGSVIQSFLLENGISETIVTSFLSLVQIIQVSVMLVISLVIDKLTNIVKITAYATIGQIALFLSLILLSVYTGVPITFKYMLVFGTGVITNVIQAVYNITCYKLPYHVIKMTDYAHLTGLLGVLIGIVGIVLSAAMSFFTAKYNYNKTMLLFFVFGCVLLIIAFVSLIRTVPVNHKQNNVPKTAKKVNLLCYKPFLVLIIPNLLRGFCTGVLALSMTIGFSVGITNKSTGAVLTLLLQISAVVGSFVYTLITKRRNDGKILVISSILLAVTMPLMFFYKSLAMLYVMYFLANFFICFINSAIPVAITKFVDYDYIGQYSSWRMLIHTLGIALANSVVTPLVTNFGATATMIIAVVCQLVSGICYFVFLKKCEYVDE